MNNSRRQFVVSSLCVAASTMLVRPAHAADDPMLSETDAQARSLGYVSDAAKVDKAKYSAYTQGQSCGTCSLFQPDPDAKAGHCLIFSGKRVAAAGWCSSYSNM
ncbi:high-potential iron-sulfur protein [Paraburkholderia acidisoli]|uniref:High-potential iron-sulfur protein n=1 Tax=Paraburkholderia acidisoli TaxID=2571748 RepID=A0A7Z2GNK0_9BURK|nr:high-potential iron-sulfur protein [Paraburkholderia acidisoli]QGZ64669.1 High potential iron-sulfur protein [Paraburkholderia acidisoli]